MAKEVTSWPDFRFTLEEISGAFGDSITVIPLLIGIGVTTEANLAHLLLFFAKFQIATGLFYRLPTPVEPMKALAALIIASLVLEKTLVYFRLNSFTPQFFDRGVLSSTAVVDGRSV